jgi:hypothetical protein
LKKKKLLYSVRRALSLHALLTTYMSIFGTSRMQIRKNDLTN